MKSKIAVWLLVLITIIGVSNGDTQIREADFRIHDRGNLWQTVKDNGTIGARDPNYRFETFPSMDWPGGPNELIKDDQRSYTVGGGIWIGGRHAGGDVFLTENGPFFEVDNGTFEDMEEIENFIGSGNYNPNEAEEKIIARWTTSESISVERISRSWSFPGLNNSIIYEYTITNQNSTTLTDVYIGFPNLIRPSYQDFIVHNGWGDDFNRTDEYVSYDQSRALLYAYDDTPNFSLPNDVGNYWEEYGELRTTGYAGFSILDADPAVDSSPQPSIVFYAQLLNNENQLSLGSTSQENLYAILSGQDLSLQANPDELLTPFMLLACGPYSMEPNSSVKIVVAEAVNGLPIEVALEGLEAQELLPAGLDSLTSSIDRAKALYQNNYQLATVSPPSPEIEIIPVPENQTITLSWQPLEESWVNPISSLSNIQEYRIYRADRSFIGPYTQIKRIRPDRMLDYERYFDPDLNKWVYEDLSISLGAGYFYTVTTMDSTGLESWWTNRNEEAVEATRAPAENTLNVTVFPNPFREVSGFPTTGSENSIVWTNLPEKCTIRIYTSSAELVKKMEHDNPYSGEEVWDQLSNARQRTAPGIYFWTVDSDVGTAKGTLLIIK